MDFSTSNAFKHSLYDIYVSFSSGHATFDTKNMTHAQNFPRLHLYRYKKNIKSAEIPLQIIM
jgi:hypothetical protein